VALNASARRAKLVASLVELRASLDTAKCEQVAAEAELRDLELALATAGEISRRHRGAADQRIAPVFRHRLEAQEGHNCGASKVSL